MSAMTEDTFLTERLRLWKDEGVAAPLNELQSIHAWCRTLAQEGPAVTMELMRSRMLLLTMMSNEVQEHHLEEEVGIYANRTSESANDENVDSPEAKELMRCISKFNELASKVPELEYLKAFFYDILLKEKNGTA